MVLIFWQGIISIHQKTFLEALAKQPSVSKVILVVEHDITPYRKNMGWEVPVIEEVQIIKSPSKEEIANIFKDYKDAIHVMGGVRIGKMMTIAYDECVKQKGRMGSMSEPFDKTGVKGKLRRLKYYYYKLRYYKHIDFFLAVGREGVNTYTGLGFDAARVFPWAYFVTVPISPAEPNNTGTKKIIYAGRIEEGKGISRFVAELEKSNNDYRLDIYGGGPEEQSLKQFVGDNKLTDKISFFPFLKYNEMITKYAHYDWVVLPSAKKDGWGVIVSEGLLNGLKGICSDICGVSWAIKSNFNGVVFSWTEDGSCAHAIDKIFDDKTFASRTAIMERAVKTLSGEAGATYFLKIIDNVYKGKSKPEAPWIDEQL